MKKKILETHYWDYYGHRDVSGNKFNKCQLHQNAWNQTLLTKLNEIVQKHNLEYPLLIRVPITLSGLLETIEHKTKNTIGNKYIVHIDKKTYDNVIYIETGKSEHEHIELIVTNYDLTDSAKEMFDFNEEIKTNDSVNINKNKADVYTDTKQVKIFGSSNFFIRLWYLISNPFRYLFTGKLKY